MKILIVSSSDVIFQSLAYNLFDKIQNVAEVVVVSEKANISAIKILRQRIKKAGLVYGISQFSFKIYDLFWLRRRITKSCRLKLSGKRLSSIPPLNSKEGRDVLRQGGFDVVIGLATSILRQETLIIPKLGFVNVHPGVLPHYRGTGNIWAIINKDWNNIGCTCHWMTSQIDVGKIIAVVRTKILFRDLWTINYDALTAGINELAILIKENKLIDTEVIVDEQQSGYYSWYGFRDYSVFLRHLRNYNKS